MAQRVIQDSGSTSTALRIVPANEVSGTELDLVFGSKGTRGIANVSGSRTLESLSILSRFKSVPMLCRRKPNAGFLKQKPQVV